jgi:hypothetical protein
LIVSPLGKPAGGSVSGGDPHRRFFPNGWPFGNCSFIAAGFLALPVPLQAAPAAALPQTEWRAETYYQIAFASMYEEQYEFTGRAECAGMAMVFTGVCHFRH